MASQNYAATHLAQIDERMTVDAKTGPIVNKGGIRLDFNGRNSCTIYTVEVVAEVDYIRSGENRFGQLAELGTGTQTFTLSQDKAFTFSVDRGNLEDSMMVQEANKAVKRQVREVSVWNTDVYRIAVAGAYAIANSQGDTAGLTTSNAYTKLLAQNDAMTEAKFPETGRYCFMSPATYSLLKQDTTFMRSCDTTVADLKKGIIGNVDGITLIKVPSTMLTLNITYLLIHESVLIAPSKFDMVRVLTEQRGIDGAVAEGRRYFDCFIPANKGAGIRYQKSA